MRLGATCCREALQLVEGHDARQHVEFQDAHVIFGRDGGDAAEGGVCGHQQRNAHNTATSQHNLLEPSAHHMGGGAIFTDIGATEEPVEERGATQEATCGEIHHQGLLEAEAPVDYIAGAILHILHERGSIIYGAARPTLTS